MKEREREKWGGERRIYGGGIRRIIIMVVVVGSVFLAQENRIWAVGLGGEYAAFAVLAKTTIEKLERENGRAVKFWDTRALQSKIPNSKL